MEYSKRRVQEKENEKEMIYNKICYMCQSIYDYPTKCEQCKDKPDYIPKQFSKAYYSILTMEENK